MATTTTTLMSFADFERIEQGADHIELLKGELIRMPPAQNRHMDTSERLFKLLDQALERLRKERPEVLLGNVHIERGYWFPGEPASWLQPDVSITYPGQQADHRYYIGAPMIAFEVVSEYDRAADLNLKTTEFLANGAEEVWVIYPKQQHALVYERSEAVRKESRAVRSGLLPGIEIPFDQIF